MSKDPILIETKHTTLLLKHPTPETEEIPAQLLNTQAYYQFFKDELKLAADTLILEEELLQRYNIWLSSTMFSSEAQQSFYNTPKTVAVNTANGAAVVTYHVLVGAYVVAVRMLNLNDKVFETELTNIGKGSFGRIIPLADQHEEFVAKRIKFESKLQLTTEKKHGRNWFIEARFSLVEQGIVEYAVAKICSMLQIGPKIKLDIGFDLVCYRDCMEFYMERCVASKDHRPESLDEAYSRLKYCVAVMHAHHLVHRDIKPANIVFSPSLGDYVLCDFGTTIPRLFGPGFLTFTYREGTERYMSPDYLSLDREGHVDLYYNDMFATERTLAQLPVAEVQLGEVCLFEPQFPSPQVVLLKSISEYLSVHPNKKYSVVDEVLIDDVERRVSPSLQFLLSSFSVSFELHDTIKRFHQQDVWANLLLKRIESVIEQPTHIKKEFNKIEYFHLWHYPSKLMALRSQELHRLEQLPRPNLQDRKKQSILMGNFLQLNVTDPRQSALVRLTLQKFKSLGLHPIQQQIQTDIGVLLKLMDEQTNRYSTFEDVKQPLEGTSNFVRHYASTILIQRFGDAGCFYARLMMLEPQTRQWSLQFKGTFIVFSRLSRNEQKMLLNSAQLLRDFRKMPVRPTWAWLRQLNHLAMALAYDDPIKCIVVVKRFLPDIPRKFHYGLCHIVATAYGNMGDAKNEVAWMEEQLKVLALYYGEPVGLLADRVLLVKAKSKLPSIDLSEVERELCAVIQEHEGLDNGGTFKIDGQLFLIRLLIQQGRLHQAEGRYQALRQNNVFEHSECLAIQACSTAVTLYLAMLRHLQKDFRAHVATKLQEAIQAGMQLVQAYSISVCLFLKNTVTLLLQLKKRVQALDILNESVTRLSLASDDMLFLYEDVIGGCIAEGSHQEARNIVIGLTDKIRVADNDENKRIIEKINLLLRYRKQLKLDLELKHALAEFQSLNSGQKQSNQPLFSKQCHFIAVRYEFILVSAYYAIEDYHKCLRHIRTILTNPLVPRKDKNKSSSCWEILHKYLQLLPPKGAMAKQLFDLYMELRLQSIRELIVSSMDRTAVSVELYSGILLQLYQINQPNRHKRRRYFNGLTSKDVYYRRLLPESEFDINTYTVFCQCWIVLGQWRSLIKDLINLQRYSPSNSMLGRLGRRFDSEKRWLEGFMVLGKLSEKCDGEKRTRLLRLLEGDYMIESNKQACKLLALSKAARRLGLRLEHSKYSLSLEATKLFLEASKIIETRHSKHKKAQ